LYVFFWVIPRRLNFISRRFRTLYLPMKMEQIECSETSAYKIQTLGNHPEENIQHTEHGESLKSKTQILQPCELLNPLRMEFMG
jgi:hypothetical protein